MQRDHEMKQRLGRLTGLLLVGIGLTLGACQPGMATEAPPASLPPVGEVSQTTPTVPSGGPGYQIRWSFRTEGAVWGTPAIGDGAVYFGSDDQSLYALDAQSGEPRWEFTTQGLVRSRPALADGLAYIASDDGYLYAVDAQDGQLAWRTNVGNFLEAEERESPGTNPDPSGFDTLQSSPVVVDGQVFVGSLDGNVYALAADSGDITWRFATGQRVRATPAVEDGIVYIGSWDGSVYALEAQTGRARWATPIGGQVQTTALAADGRVYSASRKASVVALDAQTGEILWEYDYGSNMWVESSPVLVDGTVYIGSSGNMYVLGLDSQTGALRVSYWGSSFFWSTPAVVDATLYIGGIAQRGHSGGGLLALEIPPGATGATEPYLRFGWILPVTETLMPDGEWHGVASSPVVVDDTVYFGGLDGVFYAVDLEP